MFNISKRKRKETYIATPHALISANSTRTLIDQRPQRIRYKPTVLTPGVSAHFCVLVHVGAAAAGGTAARASKALEVWNIFVANVDGERRFLVRF
jgi:hypothetical protein